MKFLLITMIAASTSLCATVAMAQQGQPCSSPGAVYTIGGKQYRCVTSYGQAHKPNWDGRSREPVPARAIAQPSGISTQQAVFGNTLSADQYKKLQNSPKGAELLRQAETLRAQQAETRKQADAAQKAGNSQKLSESLNKLEKINTDLKAMPKKAKQILVEIR
jgi:hypothetical protein